jgi:flagellar basal body-associated protein FliL
MSEKAEKKPDSAPALAGGEKKASAKGGLLTKMPVMLGGVMVLEAAVLFAGFKFLGGGSPKLVHGAELVSESHEPHGHDDVDGHSTGPSAAIEKSKLVEMQVLDFRSPNKTSGRTYLYEVSIFLVTKAEFQDKVKNIISEREALIKDRVRTIIAQSDPEKLGGGSEPGLETLRRQVKYQLDEIIGDGLIEEVLVPKCIPFRTDF